MPQPLILASGSAIRAKLLRSAGVEIEVIPAHVDEDAIKTALEAEGAPARDVADVLAEAKARRVADRFPGRIVLGSDQILVVDGRRLDKAPTVEDARRQLLALRGRPHDLISAAVIYEDARPVWRHIGSARLTMRAFSESFLDDYVARHGDDLCATVGGYKLEEDGAALFSHVTGDYFSILGLPLLEVLGFLRTRGHALE